nr:MAG TPA: hypothetical protein [Caudoviricetes sp.]
MLTNRPPFHKPLCLLGLRGSKNNFQTKIV